MILMSFGQGNIPQDEECKFMMELMAEQNPRLPQVRIVFYHCKPLRCSLEDAKAKIKTRAGGGSYIAKNKDSEKLPVHRLPLESTNPSDSFKYLMMKRDLRKKVKGARKVEVGDTNVR